ncbi:MAG TPA: hypothetical protein VN580_09050 [Clostridia bacterium]|nr:hypothetical protein [Clostridia bacterium]
MLSLIRGGPKILLFESGSNEELRNYFILQKNARTNAFDEVFETAGEEHTVIFIIDRITEVVDLDKLGDALLIAEEPDVILCNLLNDGQSHLVSRSRIATRIILLRAMGDMEKVIQEIEGDYNCVEGDVIEILNSNNESGTVVAITEKPLHRNISFKKDIYKKALFVKEKYTPLMRGLRSHALKYLNSGLGNRDWYEMEIRIFDRYSEYKLHYERLINVVEWLELGIVLGESWGKDYPRPMMSVEIYRVRFFSYYEPIYIKKILLGLELLDDGTRIVDYDLYFNRKKLNWSDAAEGEGIKVRHLMGVKYREEILSRLNEQEIEELHEMEGRILATRT